MQPKRKYFHAHIDQVTANRLYRVVCYFPVFLSGTQIDNNIYVMVYLPTLLDFQC